MAALTLRKFLLQALVPTVAVVMPGVLGYYYYYNRTKWPLHAAPTRHLAALHTW